MSTLGYTVAIFTAIAAVARAELTMEEPDNPSPFSVLDPSKFARVLGSDYLWAVENIPLFESANSTLDDVYYFRWRSYNSHIHPTGRNDSIDFVVTEFSPDVKWAGMYNTINCAAGHHMAEAGWMRKPVVMDSYTRWWVNDKARHNYYYWFASALKRNFDKTGDLELLKVVIPNYKSQFLDYTMGKLPTGGSKWLPEADCLWNSPGNEGQEATISGAGCRPLVQSMMYGEANALAALCAAIGDTDGATQMAAEATAWQRRVLRQWNTNLTSFDTVRVAPKPGPPPPPPPPPLPPLWTLLPDHNGTFCCDQSPCANGHSTFLYQGGDSETSCANRCLADSKCGYLTYHEAGWCFNSEYCNTTSKFAGKGPTFTWTPPPRRAAAAAAAATVTITPVGDPTIASDLDFSGVRELASLSSPWFFGAIPTANATAYAGSWLTAFDPDGLGGPNGLRTAEKRHAGYYCGLGCCSWSGPVWPFETAKALTAVINVLNNYEDVTTLDNAKFWDLLWPYTTSHTPHWSVVAPTKPASFFRNVSDSAMSKWLFDGLPNFWLAETGCGDHATSRPYVPNLPGPFWSDSAGMGYRYNHATFMDIVLSGVVGLQPFANGTLLVHPLVPTTVLPWFAADGVMLHGKIVAVVFDLDGSHYQMGKGLRVLVDGKVSATAPAMTKLWVQL